ncbi:MAG TPA: DUF983 domain-containing protein, partial [Cytophagaceae bacterium]
MILSILKLKCPRCHQGDIFANKNPFKFSTLSKIHKNCSCCGQDFEPEPGFYFGAMYVSYGLGVVYFLLSFLVFDYFLHFQGWLFLGIYITSLLLLWPVIF